MDKVANWVGGSLASAFFASLERSSCVTLSTTDTDDEEDVPLEVVVGDNSATRTSSGDVVRGKPCSDRFKVRGIHHVEFWCGDASNTWRRFSWGLGMQLVAKSDQTTGNYGYCSYVIRSNDLVFTFTAPYSTKVDQTGSRMPHPGFVAADARRFFSKHGFGVRAIGLLVDDADDAFRKSVMNGAVAAFSPQVLVDEETGGKTVMSEVKLFGDVVLRFISNDGFQGPFLPKYEPVESLPLSSGFLRLSYVAANVYNLLDTVNHIAKFTGFHEVAEFTSDNVESKESGLNSLSLASDNGLAVLVLSEPTHGTKRRSPIQSYLEQNEGPGVQCLAIYCDNIFSTVRDIRDRIDAGGFEFMAAPEASYYESLRGRVGQHLTEEQFNKCKELGILLGKDDRGVLLQIFTKPVGDRPTLMLEIIQRLDPSQNRSLQSDTGDVLGKDNHSALYRCLEEYEKSLGA